jgi:hypothetical protein
MKKLVKAAIGGTLGATGGAMISGTLLANNLLAPVTVPLFHGVAGAVLGFNQGIKADMDVKPIIGLTCGLAAVGTIVGAACVPLAPASFLVNVAISPLWIGGLGITGAVMGYKGDLDKSVFNKLEDRK